MALGIGGGALISPVALLLGGAIVGGGGGGGARIWEVGGGIAGLEPGTGGGRLERFAATDGVIGDVGDACGDSESSGVAAAGT